MLLLSLSEGAGSGVVEVVSPTKAEGPEVSGSRKESDFSCSYQDFNPTCPICFHRGIISFLAFFPCYSLPFNPEHILKDACSLLSFIGL